MIDYVKRYIEIGWCVLPLFDYNKFPSKIKWKDYQEKKATLEEWEEWSKLPNLTGVCLITGKVSGIVAIDVDDPTLKSEYESTVISETRSGGFHFLYRYSEKLKNTVRMDGAPIDFRGDGGLIVIPPSEAEGSDGKKGFYKWIKEPSDANLRAMSPIPEKALKFLQKPGEKVKVESTGDLIGLEQGSRNDTIYKLACTIIKKTPDDLKSARMQIDKVNQTYVPPLPKFEMDTLFNSAARFILEGIEPVPEPIELEVMDYDSMDDKALQTLERPKTAKIGLDKFDMLFDWPAGFYLICGVSNVGKGFFANWVARRFYEQNKLKTVLFSLEMPESLVRDRLLQSWSDKTKEEYHSTGATKEAMTKLKKSFRVIEFNLYDITQQTPEQFRKDFERFYKQGYRCFIFDHLLEILGATDNAGSQKIMQVWGKAFQEVSKYHKDCWLFVYTQKRIEKSSRSKKEVDSKDIVYMSDMQGAKSPIQKCDVFIGISRGRNSETTTRDFYVYVEKNRNGESKFLVDLFFAPDGNFYSAESVYQFNKLNDKVPLERAAKELFQ